MATVTETIASFNEGQVRVELDYNDANLRIGRGRVINNSTFSVWMQIVKPSRNIDRSFTVDAGQTVSRNLPSGLVYQWLLDEGLDGQGEPLGYNLSLGDIVIRCRWPA